MLFDKFSKYYKDIINNKKPGSLNATVLLLWLTAAAIAPSQSEGVYYTLIGGNSIGRN